MRTTIAVMLAAAAIASVSTPAAACGFFRCFNEALADDTYPPGELALDPGVQESVRARQGFGLSAAGFYNDPAVALWRYAAPPPIEPAAYFEPAPFGGPAVIYNPGYAHAHARYVRARYRGAYVHMK